MENKPKIIKGGKFNDERGLIRFVNDFHFKDIKRFYLIKHPDTNVVRAWQSHQFESKYFYPVSGRFVVAWVKIDNFENPSKNLISEYHQLSANNSEILFLPKGYANGLKALEENSELLIFSDIHVSNSLNDNKKYPANIWFNWEELTPKIKK
jgi:dTDP-4-dehydrorhamnose 3,5-epimerase